MYSPNSFAIKIKGRFCSVPFKDAFSIMGLAPLVKKEDYEVFFKIADEHILQDRVPIEGLPKNGFMDIDEMRKRKSPVDVTYGIDWDKKLLYETDTWHRDYKPPEPQIQKQRGILRLIKKAA